MLRVLFVGVFCLAAMADPAVAQVQPGFARPPPEGAPPVVSCRPGQPFEECAPTDAQRMVLLMLHPNALPEEQRLRVVAAMSDVNVLDHSGHSSPLSRAIQFGHRKLVATLLERGADPLAADRRGNLLLNNAIGSVSAGPKDVSDEVLVSLRLSLDQAARAKRLPARPPLNVSLAFRYGRVDFALLKLLLDYGADPAAAIHIAIDRNDPDTVRFLLGRAALAQADLDKSAYAALADRKTEMLEALRSSGADPVRHIKTGPQALLDAVRPHRSKELLELLLKGGVDSNALMSASLRATPLYRFDLSPEKLLLLLQYGADPNLRDDDRVTALAQLLMNTSREFRPPAKPAPGQEARTYRKIELVRPLLDAGAVLGGDHGGGSGRYGALGLARREDQDVIALLIQRGATLSPSERGGPIMNAIGMERDDLVLALLERDKKITPGDRQALLEASRRGWRNVVQALLAAGANADVADESGWTALGMAERRRDAVMARMLVDAGAKQSVQPLRLRLRNAAGGEFENAVATEIDDVVFFDPPRFSFSLGPEREVVFVLNTTGPDQYVQIKCERSVGLAIHTTSVVGGLGVGVCSGESGRLRELAAAARSTVDAARATLVQSGGLKGDQAQPLLAALTYTRTAGPDRSEIHYFPVTIVGHGVFFVWTVVMVARDGRQAIVVQTEINRLCENQGLRTQILLCTDPKGALSEIAQRLYTRFGEKS